MSDTDDELASAWLDGELDDDERATVADDPAVARARRELDGVRDRLAEPVPVPTGLADRQIALALEALAPPTTAGVAPVSRLDDRRRQPRSWWLSRAAAAVLVLGGLGVGLAALGDDDGGGGGEDLVMPGTEERSAATADESADSAGSALREELSTTEAPAGEAQADDAGPGAGDGEAGSVPPVEPIGSTATELLAQGPLDAAGLTDELEGRFGPAGGWDRSGAPLAECGAILDRRAPASAPHVALAISRDGLPVELVVPLGAPPVFVEPGSCEPIE